jgi:hypothetical protein
MLRISALIPDNPAEDESSVKLYKLAYSVDADAVKEAKEFSYAIMNEVYKGNLFPRCHKTDFRTAISFNIFKLSL